MSVLAAALLIVAELTAGSTQAAAPASDWNGLPLAYRLVIEDYQKDTSEATVRRLLALEAQPSAKIESIQKKFKPATSSAEELAHFRAAAMVHTDAAELLLANGRIEIAKTHLALAKQWADLCEQPGDTIRSFRRRWQVVAALMVIQQGLATGSVERARLYVNDACDRLRDDVPLLTIGGWLNEQVALAPLPLARGAALNSRAVVEKQQLLDVADGLLKRALEVEPTAVEPAIRRARVLMLKDKNVDAKRILTTLTERTDLPSSDAYLAKILLARLEEQASNYPRAMALYEEAMTILPPAQPARLGLARLRAANGDSLAAGETIAPLLDPPTWADNPWFDYLSLHLRSADAARTAMRAEVRQ